LKEGFILLKKLAKSIKSADNDNFFEDEIQALKKSKEIL